MLEYEVWLQYCNSIMTYTDRGGEPEHAAGCAGFPASSVNPYWHGLQFEAYHLVRCREKATRVEGRITEVGYLNIHVRQLYENPVTKNIVSTGRTRPERKGLWGGDVSYASLYSSTRPDEVRDVGADDKNKCCECVL